MKVLPFLLLFFFVGPVMAHAQIRLGVKAGFTVASSTNSFPEQGPDKPGEYTGRLVSAFQTGVILDVPLSALLHLQPGLQYSGRGGENARAVFDLQGAPDRVTVHRVTRVHTLELPLNLLAGARLWNGRIFGGAGPFLAYQLALDLRERYEGKGLETMDISFSHNWNNTSRLFGGINGTAGYVFGGRWTASVNYSVAFQKHYGGYLEASASYFIRK